MGKLSTSPRGGTTVHSEPLRSFIDWLNRNTKIIFNIPTGIFLVWLVGFPVILVIVASFTNWDLFAPEPLAFIGISNYVKALSETRWLNSIWHTIYFAGTSVILQLVLGLAIALLFNLEIAAKTIYRTAFMLPMLAMSTAISLVWILFFNDAFGLLNAALAILNIQPIGWVTNPSWAIPSMILVSVWQYTPFMTLLCLAGLQSLPIDPYEAALIDGTSAWQRFIHITLPLMRGHIIAATILRSIFALKEFDVIFTITGGGPSRASETMNLNIYATAFEYGRTGEAAAKGLLFFLVILAIQVLLVKLRKRGWSY